MPKPSPKVIAVLQQFATGPAIRGHRKPTNWNVNHPKTQMHNGKRYSIVWIFPQTSKTIDALGLLQSVNGDILYELTTAGRQALEE